MPRKFCVDAGLARSCELLKIARCYLKVLPMQVSHAAQQWASNSDLRNGNLRAVRTSKNKEGVCDLIRLAVFFLCENVESCFCLDNRLAASLALQLNVQSTLETRHCPWWPSNQT